MQVSKEQIIAARAVPAMDFLTQFRPGTLVPAKARNEYQLQNHDSFKINGETSLWHWKSRDVGGRSALDYLIHVEEKGFVEAVWEVLSALDRTDFVQQEWVPKERPKPVFCLPPPAQDNRRVFAYLRSRGISREVISACIRAGLLYEERKFHNAVFVGKDDAEIPRYAFLRGTSSYGKVFKMEAAGSDKRYCFCLPPAVPSKKLAVYEAAIDALAHWSLEGRADKYRLSVGGIYASKNGEKKGVFKQPPALSSFLERHPEIAELEICTDNDPAGRYAAEHIREAYQGQYRVTLNLPRREGMDYGDLAAQRQIERADFER